jgi:hypothetical protein
MFGKDGLYFAGAGGDEFGQASLACHDGYQGSVVKLTNMHFANSVPSSLRN